MVPALGSELKGDVTGMPLVCGLVFTILCIDNQGTSFNCPGIEKLIRNKG